MSILACIVYSLNESSSCSHILRTPDYLHKLSCVFFFLLLLVSVKVLTKSKRRKHEVKDIEHLAQYIAASKSTVYALTLRKCF